MKKEGKIARTLMAQGGAISRSLLLSLPLPPFSVSLRREDSGGGRGGNYHRLILFGCVEVCR